MRDNVYVVKGAHCFGIFLSSVLLVRKINGKNVAVVECANVLEAREELEGTFVHLAGFDVKKIKCNKMYFISAKTGEIYGLAK